MMRARRKIEQELMATVIVEINQEGDMYVAASDDLPGLHLVSHSWDDVVADIPDAIAFLYKMNAGIDVQVRQASCASTLPEPVLTPDRFVVCAQAAGA